MSDALKAATVDDRGQVSPEGPPDDRLPELDTETRERREAALSQIRVFGDPVLKSRASEVTSFGPELEREAEHMVSIMRDAIGVGLAATQLGVMHRLLVFAAGPDATPTAVANPELDWTSAELALAEEGCLSLPRIAVDVERPLFARVRGRDVHGEPILLEASGLEARVLQHEIDHLDGVLMLDRTTREQRKAALRALREDTAYSPSAEVEEGREPTDGSAAS
jgi:peptide deformylase